MLKELLKSFGKLLQILSYNILNHIIALHNIQYPHYTAYHLNLKQIRYILQYIVLYVLIHHTYNKMSLIYIHFMLRSTRKHVLIKHFQPRANSFKGILILFRNKYKRNNKEKKNFSKIQFSATYVFSESI